MRFITKDVIGRTVIIVLALVLAFVLATLFERPTQAQGSYSLDMIFTDMWDVSAPCYNSGNCNFSCNSSNVGRSCYANICRGTGNGEAAYLDHNEYVCNYYPPAACPAGQIGTPPNCRFPTCADDPTMNGCACSATNACGASSSGTYNGGSCSATAPAVTDACPSDPGLQCSSSQCSAAAPSCSDYPGHIGSYPYCFTPDPCQSAPNSCGMRNTGTRVDYAGNCSASTPSDSLCAPSGPPAPTVTFTANPNPATTNTALTWSSTNATSCTGVGTSFSTGGATSGTDATVTPGFTYQLMCTGPGGNANAQVVVGLLAGGPCAGTGPLTATATPNRIDDSATPVTITWSSPNVSGVCTVTNVSTGAEVGSSGVSMCSTSGSATVTGITSQTMYRVTCGSLTKDVVVNVVPRFGEF